jgi:hypothetical protein
MQNRHSCFSFRVQVEGSGKYNIPWKSVEIYNEPPAGPLPGRVFFVPGFSVFVKKVTHEAVGSGLSRFLPRSQPV